MQNALGGYQYDGKNMLQSEFAKRENERKTSMNFGGFGSGFYPNGGNVNQSPAFASHLLNSPMMQMQNNGGGFMVDD